MHRLNPRHPPYEQLGFWGRYWRRVRSGSPSLRSRVCKTCFNVMDERGDYCSDRCADLAHGNMP